MLFHWPLHDAIRCSLVMWLSHFGTIHCVLMRLSLSRKHPVRINFYLFYFFFSNITLTQICLFICLPAFCLVQTMFENSGIDALSFFSRLPSIWIELTVEKGKSESGKLVCWMFPFKQQGPLLCSRCVHVSGQLVVEEKLDKLSNVPSYLRQTFHFTWICYERAERAAIQFLF